MVMPYHLHMPSYFLETFTEYPYIELFCKYYLYVSKELILLEKDKDFLKQ